MVQILSATDSLWASQRERDSRPPFGRPFARAALPPLPKREVLRLLPLALAIDAAVLYVLGRSP